MGKARYIYLTDEMDEALRSVPNRSALIVKLLEKYFKKRNVLQMSPEQLRNEIEIKSMEEKLQIKIKKIRNGGKDGRN